MNVTTDCTAAVSLWRSAAEVKPHGEASPEHQKYCTGELGKWYKCIQSRTNVIGGLAINEQLLHSIIRVS